MSKRKKYACSICHGEIYNNAIEIKCRKYVDKSYDHEYKKRYVVHICPECWQQAQEIISNGQYIVHNIASYVRECFERDASPRIKALFEKREQEKNDEREPET